MFSLSFILAHCLLLLNVQKSISARYFAYIAWFLAPVRSAFSTLSQCSQEKVLAFVSLELFVELKSNQPQCIHLREV